VPALKRAPTRPDHQPQYLPGGLLSCLPGAATIKNNRAVRASQGLGRAMAWSPKGLKLQTV
jgi:hypothetical protein